MLGPEVFAARRARLLTMLPGPLLLLGNGRRDRNLPGSELPFRQDSTFLYLTGCDQPDAAAWIDADGTTLFLPEPAPDDDLWHGHVTTANEQRTRYDVQAVRPFDADALRALAGRRPRTLAVPDPARTALASEIAGRPLQFAEEPGDADLVDAVITLRRTKSAEEVEELREAGRITGEAHRLAMRLTRPGVHEAALTAAFEAFLAARGCTVGYETILTQRGEILHNHAHDEVLTAGRLLLLDGGAELRRSGYTADVTRTWPVNGRYTPRQRAAYEAVLASQQAAIDTATVGTRYRRVHEAAALVIAQFLLDEGLLRGTTASAAVERGAHALFFPHGVGHLLGLDVHDLKAFGDRGAYPPGAARSEQFGLCYLRLDLPLEAGWTLTIEPGFYVVPAILHNPALRERFADVLDVERALSWVGFGGIRIEDDVHITPHGPEILTAGAPKHPDEVEALIGAGARLEELLS